MAHDSSCSYKGSALYVEDVPLRLIADAVGTPTYVYSKAAIVDRVQQLRASVKGLDLSIYYAVKANSNLHILRLMKQLGCGADIVSGGELYRAQQAGIAGKEIVFSGVGKTQEEISQALKAQVGFFNVESISELHQIDQLSHSIVKRTKEKISVALRVNPNVDAKTHPYISTGLKENKFGLDQSELQSVFSNFSIFKNINICGLSCHIGSQILELKPYEQAWREVLNIAKNAPMKITHIDLGGGMGISYSNKGQALPFVEFGSLIKKVFGSSNFHLGLEPGRSLVGAAGYLLTELTAIKARPNKIFYIVDAGMNDLLRPALYQAHHEVLAVTKHETSKQKVQTVDIVGPVCESSDVFLKT
jgi:diaminopimelate decarboxylase